MVTPVKRKIPNGAMDRIQNLEDFCGGLVSSLNKALNQLQHSLGVQQDAMAEVVAALVEQAGGVEPLSAIISKHRAEARANLVAADQAALAKRVADGQLVVAPTVGERSLVVYTERDAEAAVIMPGRHETRFKDVMPAAQASLLGQSVGAVVVGVDNHTIEVLEIYDEVTPPAMEA